MDKISIIQNFQNDWNGGLDNQLKPEYYQTWADYHLNWMKLMKDDGMKIRPETSPRQQDKLNFGF